MIQLAFRRIDRRNQQFLDFNTHIQDVSVIIITAFDQKFQPIFTFRAFFESNLQLRNKISRSVSVKRLSNIRSYTRTAANQLIGKNTFFFVLLYVIADFDNL